MIPEEFIDKMSIYFTEDDLSKLTITPYDLEYFEDAIKKANQSTNVRVISVNRGKYNTNYSQPYLTIALTKEGYDKFRLIVESELKEIDNTEVCELTNLVYGIIIKYIKKDTGFKVKGKITRIWLNKVFKVLNKNYNLKIKMLRTW